MSANSSDSATPNRPTAATLALAREFEAKTTSPMRRQVELPLYESRFPEAINNYNLPDDRRAIEEKVQQLHEQFPTFANKSADDLEDLLRFEDLFQAHIDGLEQVQLMRTLEYELREENERLAEVNLSAEDELRKMRENVAELQMFASSLTTRLYELVQEHLDMQKPYSPLVLLQRLKDEFRKMDGESEQLANEFLDKSESVEASECEEFVRQYKQLRTKYHSMESRSKIAETAYKSGTLAGVPMTMDR
ncbi:hypothetical protein GGI25_004986 [Coemansia spiralis]|uniref:VPS37 C-terminal domain-containing protein n=2 Tax=Coemansia TaxID=4863 RepID=A0A9W8G503_9FUNG|nr:hypothetical protein BX070DRAFT_223875 [Coemansia spiralis]KAJ1989199.1 hypothetical protein EDC05_004855 [Coemansia umbellata]KAJ2620153.1 hypothetical protein GGI26_005268 [Coemansia sp. RSA 1358]KAJ2672668.1 hypothetical protein GGI25_004986 [Coemansia spiralis]